LAYLRVRNEEPRAPQVERDLPLDRGGFPVLCRLVAASAGAHPAQRHEPECDRPAPVLHASSLRVMELPKSAATGNGEPSTTKMKTGAPATWGSARSHASAAVSTCRATPGSPARRCRSRIASPPGSAPQTA